MNKATQLVFGILVLGLLIFNAFQKSSDNLGQTFVAASFYYGATETSSSIPIVATTTNPVLSLDANRTGATVCYVPLSGTSTVWLHQVGIASTTGVLIGTGIPLYPVIGATTTQNFSCIDFPGFKGYLYGVAQNPASTTQVSWK